MNSIKEEKRTLRKKHSKRLLAILLILCMIILGAQIFAIAQESQETNIAHKDNGTTVSTTHVNTWAEETAPAYSIQKLIDGKFKNVAVTETSTAFQYEQIEIKLQFNNEYSMNKICLYAADPATKGGFPVDFTLDVYTSEGWKTVVTKTDYQVTEAGCQTFDIEEVTGTAVRLISTENSITDIDVNTKYKYGIYLTEFEVYGKEVSQTGTNIAHKDNGATVSTDHINTWAENDMNGAYGMGKLNDGTIGNVGMTATSSSYQNEPIEIKVQFDGKYRINKIRLYAADPTTQAGFPADFTLDVYTSAGWQTVVNKTNYQVTAGGWLTFEIDEVECTAVRLLSTKNNLVDNGDQYGIYLYEFEVYGEEVVDNRVNAALSGTVHMECPDWAQASFGPKKLVDGKKQIGNMATTDGVTEQNTTKTITIEFAEGAYTVDQINLVPCILEDSNQTSFPVDFSVSVWNGTEWQQVAEKTDYMCDKSTLELTFDAVVCNAVRITATKLGASEIGEYALRFGEIEALGIQSDATISAPNMNDEDDDSEQLTPSVNAALKGTVYMDCPEWAQASFGPKKLVDGKKQIGNMATTAGFTEQDTTQTITVVFAEGAYAVNQINLVPCIIEDSEKTSFPIDFTVSVWDGSKWVQVAEKTGYECDKSTLELTFATVVCNAVRVTATKLGACDPEGNYALRFGEIEALGIKSTEVLAAPNLEDTGSEEQIDARTNAALSGTVSMECPDWAKASFGPKKLVDGKKQIGNMATTAGFSDQNTTQTITIVFKEGAYTVDQINLVPCILEDSEKTSFPIDFKVSVWNGSKWIQVAEKTGYQCNKETLELTFGAVLCNAIRVTATKLGPCDPEGTYALRFGEIEALGIKSTEVLAAPATSSSTGNSGSSNGVTIDHSKNIALNCPVKASSDLSLYGGAVGKINDGKSNTFWASDNATYTKGDEEWVEINLLKNYSINTVILLARNYAYGFPYDFTISVFYDGTWTDVVVKNNFVADESTFDLVPYEFSFPTIVGNKIRISSNNFRLAGSDSSMCINEMVVYGSIAKGDYVLPNENVISSATTVNATSSLEDFGYYLQNLIDGDLATEWSSDAMDEADSVQVLEFDLKNEIQVGEIQMKPNWCGNGFPVDFTISVFENGTWIDVYSATDYEKPVDEAIQRFSFEPREISKFKITVTKLPSVGGVYVWKMNEVMAYPYATGDDFDLTQVEEILYEKEYVSAEVKEAADDSSIFDIQLWKLIAGTCITIVTFAGMILILVQLKKKQAV